MKTQYYTAASLDGFIATVDDSLEWLFPLGDIADTSYPTFIQDVGAIAMGSATYQWMLRHVVGRDAKRPQPWPYQQPTWVFSSRTLPPVAGADIRWARGDVRPVHADMVRVAGGKNIWIVGGGELAGRFHDHGLLDELFVQVGSVTLGAGKAAVTACHHEPTAPAGLGQGDWYRLRRAALRSPTWCHRMNAGVWTGIRGLCLVAALLGNGPENGSAQEADSSTGPRLTNLAGSRNQPGLFTQRLVIPAHFCSPVHSHDHDLHGLVLRGVLWMGFLDSLGRLQVREYPSGSFVPVPAGRRHVEGSPEQTEIHLSGIGPLRTTVVDSATPSRCTPDP